MKTVSPPFVLISLASMALANTAPEVVIQSAEMRPDSTLMDVVYRVNDPDDATVKTRALAFVDGVRSFANVIRPVTFLDGTAANLGDTVAANVDHTLTWDVGADWDIDLGQIKFEVLAMDERGLLPFDWITIPEAGGKPELTISLNSPTNAEVLDALFWQYADGDPGLTLANGVVSGSSADVFEGIILVDGVIVQRHAAPYILKQMDLAVASYQMIRHAVAARSSIAEPDNWHATPSPWVDIDLIVGWPHAIPPSGLNEVVAISAGMTHALALLGDGTVVGWGDDTYGKASPPEGLSGVTAIAASYDHNLVLLGDGTVVGWGSDTYGQITPPAGLSNVSVIATSVSHSLALLQNGTVVGWGDNGHGQATPPAGLSNVTAIAANYGYSLAVLSNGTVVAWGSRANALPTGLANVKAIAAGGGHDLALLQDGTVVGWGHGDKPPPDGLANVSAIDTGNHSLALLSDGTVIGWGTNYRVDAPAGLTNVTAITVKRNSRSSGTFSLALIKSSNP